MFVKTWVGIDVNELVSECMQCCGKRERGGEGFELFFAFRCNNEFGVEFLTVEGREENDVCY